MAKAENRKERKQKKGGSKAAGVGIIAALLLLGGGLGYSQFGSGSGGGADTTGPDKSATVQSEGQGQSTAVTPADQGQSEVPQTIVVKISENEVTINGEAVTDKETLKTYINKYNADSRSFVLEDDKSIKEAYDWVTEAFSELEVQLTVKQ
ncbi:MAG: hypothetical protein K6G45_10275 [Lachnospiraceae bacterium]|nr:hypothetical protein [Lachnospiraceae bacterium]MCR5768861.1 hypothetical protein [Lachnospiraceae bacterium]